MLLKNVLVSAFLGEDDGEARLGEARLGEARLGEARLGDGDARLGDGEDRLGDGEARLDDGEDRLDDGDLDLGELVGVPYIDAITGLKSMIGVADSTGARFTERFFF